MKRIAASILLFTFSIGLCFFSYFYLEGKTKEFDSYLVNCAVFIDKEDYGNAQKEIEKSKQFWQRNENKFKILTDSNFCETVEHYLDTLNFCFSEGEYTEVKNSINKCRHTLRHISEKEKLSFEIIL